MEDVAHHLLKTEKAVDDLDAAIRSLHQGSPRKTMDSTAEIVPLHSTRKRTAAVSSISAMAVQKNIPRIPAVQFGAIIIMQHAS